jgi:aspartate/methionine/tyrosine aminotransferase
MRNNRDWTSARVRQLPWVGSRVVELEADRLRAAGQHVLRLASHPKREPPPHVVEAATRAMRSLELPPSRGLLELRQAIAQRIAAKDGRTVEPNQVLITDGAMHALFVAVGATLDPGDGLLVPAPHFFLEGVVEPLGVELQHAPLAEADGFRWDVERIEAAITSTTRALLVTTPGNPTGVVMTEEELSAVAELALRRGLLLIADESYDRLVYSGSVHRSIFSDPRVAGQTLLIRSFTKSYAMPAWRLGFLAGPPAIVEQATKFLEWQVLSVNHIAQHAALAVLNGPQDWLAGIAAEFEANRDRLFAVLRTEAAVRCVQPEGAPFLFPSLADLGMDGDRAARWLLREYGIASTPGSALQSSGHIRVPIGGPPAVIDDAVARLTAALASAAGAAQTVGVEA